MRSRSTIPKTYKVFGEGAAFGIFQFESSGMRELLRKAKPERLDDLIALNALYRPGPLKSGMVDDWVARKQGRTEVKYELPQLEPILSDTYGVIAYQEQVMRIAQALAGFSLGQADVLRKAMGKKDPKVMAKQREAFMDGARAKGINEKKATKIFDLMEYFAGYGFNKSHSTAYAFLAYQTAYLKANYPWHFAAALLTIEAQNTDKLAMYLAESRDRGIPVLPPDINESQLHFSVEAGKGVRFGLTAIKGARRGSDSSHPRRAGAARRTDSVASRLVRRARSSASRTSACSKRSSKQARAIRWSASTHASAAARAAQRHSRPALCRDRWRLRAWQPASAEQGSRPGRSVRRRRGQRGADHRSTSRRCPVVRDRAADIREGNARAVLDRTSDRSIRRRSSRVRRQDDCRSRAQAGSRGGGRCDEGEDAAGEPLARPENGSGNGNGRVAEDISIGGIVSGLRPLKTRKGDRMCVFTLDDAAGSIEVVVFPETFKQHGHYAENGRSVLVHGRFERDDESVRILATEIAPIEMVRERLAKSVAIRLSMPPHGRATFERLLELLAQHKGDRRVAFVILEQDRHLRVTADVSGMRVRPSERLVSEVEKICGSWLGQSQVNLLPW